MAITLSIFNHWSHETHIVKCVQRQEAAEQITGITYSQLTNAINKGTIPYIVWRGKVYIPEDVVSDISKTWHNMALIYQELLSSYEHPSLCAFFKDVRENESEMYIVENFKDLDTIPRKSKRYLPRDEYMAKAA